MKTALATDKAPQAIGPYSQAIEVNGLIFVSGQIALDGGGALVGGGVAAQTERAILNMAAILQCAGVGLGSVVKTTVYMTDLSQFAAMNEVYAKHFQAPYPARATVQVAGLPKGAVVEIDAVAAR